MTVLAFSRKGLLNCPHLKPVSEVKIKTVKIDLQSIKFLNYSVSIDSSEVVSTVTLSLKITLLYKIQGS